MPSTTEPAPKYYLVKTTILDMIKGQKPGTTIPTERALAEQLGASRTTVRQAIGELVAEGRLNRTQGSGTFIAAPKLTHVRQLTSFSEDTSSQGKAPSSRLLSVTQVPAGAAVAEKLGIAAGQPVHRVERIRLADNEPLAHETAYLLGDLPNLECELEMRGSLYATLVDAYGITITDVEDAVETLLAGPEEVRLLDVEMGSPLLLIERTSRNAAGEPVEWTSSKFRGDRFRFIARTRAE